ncbi:hypothetical protein ACFE04_021165 [Oxalis oulophora]
MAQVLDFCEIRDRRTRGSRARINWQDLSGKNIGSRARLGSTLTRSGSNEPETRELCLICEIGVGRTGGPRARLWLERIRGPKLDLIDKTQELDFNEIETRELDLIREIGVKRTYGTRVRL